MSISSFFPFEPTTGQWLAIKKLAAFFDNGQQVFVFRGFAGTGKTTLVKGVLDYLDSVKRPYVLMASTGRAARVLSLKTGRTASTIHSTIYSLDVGRSQVDESQKLLAFRLRPNIDDEETIYFIDEASMIADKSETNQTLLFDDGRFLDHIFSYADKRKVVFIGDTAQLPPVNCGFSAALDPDYLQASYKKKIVEITLTEVKRQSDLGGILFNATQLREYLVAGKLPPVGLQSESWGDIETSANIWVALKKYAQHIDANGYDQAIFITYSNGGAHYLNCEVRKQLYKQSDLPLQTGEWLIVAQNNYHTGYNNGQHLQLVTWHDSGEKVGKLRLVDADVRDPETGTTKKVKLVYDLLYRKDPNLSFDEDREFTIDFVIRMRHMGIRPGSDEFIMRLMIDRRLNALRAKFGYAVTCHKAQGGEWDRVFLNFEPAFEKMQREGQYRWLYTAITRASKQLSVPRHPMLY